MQGLTTSCSDWLEVNSSSETSEEVMFEAPEGYHTAVNGVYRLLSEPSLYGRDLSWGVASVLGNNYDAERLPYRTSYDELRTYRELAAYNYTDTRTTNLVDPIWEAAYRVVANCNNVIASVTNRDESFFPDGKQERNMILGEMLGVRAMVHFDLLRLFAPSTKADDGKTYIPYMAIFPDRGPVHLTVAATLELIIADLEQAKSLLADFDKNGGYFARYNNRLMFTDSPYIVYNNYRGTHMNYFAASAILARTYQWRGGPGDAERAYQAALEVYQLLTDFGTGLFTPDYELATVEHIISRKMPHDILLAFYNPRMYDIVAAELFPNSAENFFCKNDRELFSGDEDDFRLTALINTDKISRRWTMPTSNLTDPTTANIIKFQGPLIPVARTSEMIYIICEYLADTDLSQAIELLERVRTARGAKALLSRSLTKAEFLEKLYIDMTREFMSEGQTFQLYKRLNRPMYNGAGTIDMTGHYVLPVPRSENSYINL
jgi:hypothetical protein